MNTTVSINLKYVSRLLGLLLIFLAVPMIISLLWAVAEYFYSPSYWRPGSEVVLAFGASILLCLIFGGGLILVGRNARRFLGYREALLLVSLTWFCGAILAALPYWIWGQIHSFLPNQDQSFIWFINCFFESMSGLTTTGSTILSNIESIPRGLLFWRSFTHWLGGLGIVVMFVAVLPSLGGGTKRLFAVESTGVSQQGITSNIQESARVLIMIYVSLTIVQIGLMKLVDQDLSWLDIVCHTFSTLATGGLSNFNAGAGQMSMGIQWVTSLFMLLAGINFGLYHLIITGKVRVALENTELRVYLGMVIIASLIIGVSIYNTSYHTSTGSLADSGVLQAVTDSVFQTLSILTTTGFTTVNYEEWSPVAKAVLLVLMVTGGCAGSTAGGIKIIRIVTTAKLFGLELEKSYRPHVVRPIKVGSRCIDEPQRASVLAYVLGFFVIVAIGASLLLITERNISVATAISATIVSLNNIGPGFDQVGAIQNYGWFSFPGKLIISLLMPIGRLEVFAVLVIFMPKFWRVN